MPPTGFGRPGFVIKLKKAPDGIKQWSYLGAKLNKGVLEKLGFKCADAEPNLHVQVELRIIISVFADNILPGYLASITLQYQWIKYEYSTFMKIETFEIIPIALFCGIEVSRDLQRKTLTMKQKDYIKREFEEYKPQGAREISILFGLTV